MAEPRSQTETMQPLDHEYDGIREFDNHLPNWWLATLWLAIVFGYGYFVYYHVLPDTPGAMAAYEAELAEAAEARLANAGPALTDDALAALAGDPGVSGKGAALFAVHCVACHGAQAQGVIGPNLTDGAWLHGGRPTDVLNTISTGVAAKGMPAWEPALGPEKVQLLSAYVVSLKGKNVAGKEPQGELVP